MPMKIAIIAGGPSVRLWHLVSRLDFLGIVAINTAIDLVPSPDWWATAELANPLTWGTYLRRRPAPKIGIATDGPATHYVLPPLQAGDLAPHWPLKVSRRRFTGPMVLAWAADRWPDLGFSCFGFDLGGTAYHDGRPVDANMDSLAERWAIERRATAAVIAANPGRFSRIGFKGWPR